MLSITTDYVSDRGNPEPYLRRIAEAGFSHVHWCHHWNTDYYYTEPELEQIGHWLHDFGLSLLDVHGSEGLEKAWVSELDYERLAGVELVKNRIDLAARFGGDAVVMHLFEPRVKELRPRFWDQARRSLDALEPYARSRGVRIALENLYRPLENGWEDNFALLGRCFAAYAPDYLGLCFDSGHAVVGEDRMDKVAALQDRILVLHLHDNDRAGDQHKLLFSASIDWARTAQIVAASPYRKPISMEVQIRHSGADSPEAFLHQAFDTGTRFSEMVDAARRGDG